MSSETQDFLDYLTDPSEYYIQKAVRNFLDHHNDCVFNVEIENLIPRVGRSWAIIMFAEKESTIKQFRDILPKYITDQNAGFIVTQKFYDPCAVYQGGLRMQMFEAWIDN